MHCETCNGKRFNRETLEVRYKGKSISDVLEMTIDEAGRFLPTDSENFAKVKTLQDVGLGLYYFGSTIYHFKWRRSTTYKIGNRTCQKQTGNTLYILDEPTTGLHFEDVKILMEAINQLVELGKFYYY